MKTRAQQISDLDVELRAIGALTDAELKRYLKLAFRAGGPECSGQLDRRASLLLALHAPRGRRGPAARDPVAAAIWRSSPTRQRDTLCRVIGAVRDATGPTCWKRVRHVDFSDRRDWAPLDDAAGRQP